MRKIERENSGKMKAGQDLVAAGFAGMAGTQRILEARRQELLQRFSAEYLEMAEEKIQQYRMCMKKLSTEDLRMGQLSEKFGVTEYEPAGEGGILTAIWTLTGAYEMGVTFSLRDIPVLQETIEICEQYELNPYRLYSDDCCLMTAVNGGQLVRSLAEIDIPAKVIGKMNRGIAREMIIDGGRGFLERPQTDELWKVLQNEQQ